MAFHLGVPNEIFAHAVHKVTLILQFVSLGKVKNMNEYVKVTLFRILWTYLPKCWRLLKTSLVILKDVVQDMFAIVTWCIPSQTDTCFGSIDLK